MPPDLNPMSSSASVLLLALTASLLVGFSSATVVPEIQWAPCPNNTYADPHPTYECATIPMPLDHKRPDGAQISLFAVKRPASGTAPKRGTFFWGAGGPGVPGTKYVPQIERYFPRDILDAFDVVGWDPRGVGQSTPVTCFSSETDFLAYFWGLFPQWRNNTTGQVTLEALEALQYISGSAFPMSKSQVATFWQLHSGLYKRCRKMHGSLLDFISTADSATDLNLMRQAVGDDKIFFYGGSYGTLLGQVYANMFPHNIQALTIDGNINPLGWFNSSALVLAYRLNSDAGTYATFDQLLWLCGTAQPGACPFSAGSYAKTRTKWTQLWNALLQAPVVLDGSNGVVTGVVTASMLGAFVSNTMTFAKDFKDIPVVLQAIWEASSSNSVLSPGSRPWVPIPPVSLGDIAAGIVFNAITCIESPFPSGGHLHDAYFNQAVGESARSGLFSYLWMWAGGYGTALCSQWGAKGRNAYLGPFNKATSATLLVIGNKFDPQCPFEDSRRSADDVLSNARMLSVNGVGHCAWRNPSACAYQHISAYYLNGTLPPEDTICQQDSLPFNGTLF